MSPVGLLLLAAAAQAAPAPPAFNPAAPENRQVLPAFSYATVEPVLTQLGARFERAGSEERPALSVTFANGRRAAILFGACEGPNCKALSLQAMWNAPSGTALAQLTNAIAGFNQRYAFSRAFVGADGRPSLQRYLIADYGFIRGNLAVNLVVFAGQIERFVAEVLQAPPPAATPAPAPPAQTAPATPDPAAPRRRPGPNEGAA
jgi:hypothetical protein